MTEDAIKQANQAKKELTMRDANKTCPSKFDLAHWAAERDDNNKNPALSQHVASCGRCHAYVGELSEARQMLLGSDPARASLNAARSILAAAEDRRLHWWQRRLLWPIVLLPAAALVGVFALVDRTPSPVDSSVAMNTATQSEPAARPSVRSKGSFALTIVCKRGESMFTVADGDAVQAGDRLRFEYTQTQPGFLMVFSVDDAGAVFPYYDESSLRSVATVAGNQVALPGSVELDAHKGLERVFALWSAAPLSGDSVRAAVTQALAQAAGDLRKLQRLSIEAEQTSYLLARP